MVLCYCDPVIRGAMDRSPTVPKGRTKGQKWNVTRNLFEAEREHVRALKGIKAFECSAGERRNVSTSEICDRLLAINLRDQRDPVARDVGYSLYDGSIRSSLRNNAAHSSFFGSVRSLTAPPRAIAALTTASSIGLNSAPDC
jgi:hypothetical protein